MTQWSTGVTERHGHVGLPPPPAAAVLVYVKDDYSQTQLCSSTFHVDSCHLPNSGATCDIIVETKSTLWLDDSADPPNQAVINPRALQV